MPFATAHKNVIAAALFGSLVLLPAVDAKADAMDALCVPLYYEAGAIPRTDSCFNTSYGAMVGLGCPRRPETGANLTT